MNFKKNEKYAAIAFYSFITVGALALMVLLILNFPTVKSYVTYVAGVLAPFTYGLIIAYLCNHVMKYYERTLFSFKSCKTDHPKLRRGLSLFLTFVTVVILLAIIVYAVIPQISESYTDFVSQLGSYIQSVTGLADKLAQSLPSELFGEYESMGELLHKNGINISLKSLLSDSYSLLQVGLNYIVDYGVKILGALKNILLGFIIAIYFLASKEKLCAQVKKILASFTSRRTYLNVIRLMRFTDKTFGGFLIGKIIDSIIIGILTCIILAIFQMPYYPLISVIVGVTNIIPFFGPFIGAIPSALIIFIVSPMKALVFVVLIFIIQQLDGNVIGPKILGDSIGVSALWVVISITLCGGFFGFAGMVFGVPLVAVCYALFKQYVEKRLRHKNMPQHTNFYKNDPPLHTDLDPELIFIDSDTPVTQPTISDDVPEDPVPERNEGALASAFHKIKDHNHAKGKKK